MPSILLQFFESWVKTVLESLVTALLSSRICLERVATWLGRSRALLLPSRAASASLMASISASMRASSMPLTMTPMTRLSMTMVPKRTKETK